MAARVRNRGGRCFVRCGAVRLAGGVSGGPMRGEGGGQQQQQQQQQRSVLPCGWRLRAGGQGSCYMCSVCYMSGLAAAAREGTKGGQQQAGGRWKGRGEGERAIITRVVAAYSVLRMYNRLLRAPPNWTGLDWTGLGRDRAGQGRG